MFPWKSVGGDNQILSHDHGDTSGWSRLFTGWKCDMNIMLLWKYSMATPPIIFQKSVGIQYVCFFENEI